MRNEVTRDVGVPVPNLERSPRAEPVRGPTLKAFGHSSNPTTYDVTLVRVQIVIEITVIDVLPGIAAGSRWVSIDSLGPEIQLRGPREAELKIRYGLEADLLSAQQRPWKRCSAHQEPSLGVICARPFATEDPLEDRGHHKSVCSRFYAQEARLLLRSSRVICPDRWTLMAGLQP